ncbi:ER membrane protein complex subunit 2-like [Babylonia areolata]|uniref:ER membrane protein complex subunit 2-like n=1 Tax=Babylonia areolata TaxID=304850 RepID=UPI003FD23FD1
MAQNISWEEARGILRKLREEQVRDGDLVVKLWEDVLMDASHKLGNELWNVYEQVCVASLDCQRLDVTEMCIAALDAKFPGSVRVKRLEGMLLEAEGSYAKAAEIYQDISDKDDANMFAKKRLVAILKAQKKIPEAIDKLNDYLKKFMTDYEAWNELCDLYLALHDYTNASFCLEELIMSNPHNHLYHQKYADLKYTYGGTENMELARSYYAQAVKLCPNNMRALYGLFLSATNLSMSSGKGAKERSLNSKYAAWAADQISTKYKAQQPEEQLRETKVLESIEKLLESLQVST